MMIKFLSMSKESQCKYLDGHIIQCKFLKGWGAEQDKWKNKICEKRWEECPAFANLEENGKKSPFAKIVSKISNHLLQ